MQYPDNIIISTRIPSLSCVLRHAVPLIRSSESPRRRKSDSYLTRCSFTFPVCIFSRGHQVSAGSLTSSLRFFVTSFYRTPPPAPTPATPMNRRVCFRLERERESVLSAIGAWREDEWRSIQCRHSKASAAASPWQPIKHWSVIEEH